MRSVTLTTRTRSSGASLRSFEDLQSDLDADAHEDHVRVGAAVGRGKRPRARAEPAVLCRGVGIEFLDLRQWWTVLRKQLASGGR
ncbi:hypothetical protein ColKHC_14182 [Colletotrichum higginsianum]|nr:hypothetical protein ColKHC_14182 [Colletotrichum higginsianum]